MDTRGGGDLRGLLSSRDWYVLVEGDSDVVVSCILFLVARQQLGNLDAELLRAHFCKKTFARNFFQRTRAHENYSATLKKGQRKQEQIKLSTFKRNDAGWGLLNL